MLRVTIVAFADARPRVLGPHAGRAGPVGTTVTLKLLRGREQVVLLLPPVIVLADFSHASAAKGHPKGLAFRMHWQRDSPRSYVFEFVLTHVAAGPAA